MKKDIRNRDDIEVLINSFYQKVICDELLGAVFTDVVQVNWVKHLPVMYDFWENTLFYTGNYDGNPLDTHRRLHQMTALTTAQFRQWNLLFATSVDELFEGEKASLAKQRAQSISDVMQGKIQPKQNDTDQFY
jgi:hemoglobin